MTARTRASLARSLVALGAATLLSVSAVGAVRDTSAYFTDTATIATTGGIFGGYLNPPTGVNCSTAGGTYIRWTAPTGNVPPTGWTVYYTNTVTGVQSTDSTVPVGTTQWRPPTLVGTATYNVYVASTRGSWTSAGSSPTVQIRVVFSTYSCP